jgi:uncharacterized protein (DUF1330 family)
MAAYVISVAKVLDAQAWVRYRAIAGPASARYGARYLARGATPAQTQVSSRGSLTPDHTVTIIEFPSMELLQSWYDSPEYSAARAIAATACERDLLFVEGVIPDLPIA